MKSEILKCLKSQKDYISGQKLAEGLKVSRTAVWKMIKQLRQDGYEIDAVSNKGYRLCSAGDILSREELELLLDEQWAAERVFYYPELDSTNTKAKQLAELGEASGILVVADAQTAGKGRRGRHWVSPDGGGIWMSLMIRPELPPSAAPMLALVTALSVCSGIERVTGLPAQIKWPNDIVINGKKICGILIEMSSEPEQIHYVVAGIGINVNLLQIPEEIAETATSCRIEAGKSFQRTDFIAQIMKEQKYYLQRFMEKQDMSELKSEYCRKLVNLECEVKVVSPSGQLTGVAVGITDLGELLVRSSGGSIATIVSGEVSVRGIYGYV